MVRETFKYLYSENILLCLIASVIIGFVINPFFTVFLLLIIVLITNIEDERIIKLFICTITTFLSLINTTKGLTSDFEVYYYNYLSVPRLGFIGLMNLDISGGQEIGYRIISYLGYYLSFGYYKLYVFYISVLIYSLMFSAIYMFYKSFKAPKRMMICAIIICAFFSQYFSLTMHLIRQELAQSLMMYIISLRILKHKANWVLLFVPMLIHYSMITFIFFYLIKPLWEKVKIKNLFVIILFLFVAGFVISNTAFFAQLFSFSNSLSYGFNRIEDGTLISDNTDELNKLYIYIVSLPMVIISFKCVCFIKNRVKDIDFLFNIVIIFSILVLSLSSAPLLQYRFYFMLYNFIPFVIPLLFLKKTLMSNIFLVCISSFMYLRFWFLYNYMTFSFAPLDKVLSSSILYYL